jgi:hypothetical protein
MTDAALGAQLVEALGDPELAVTVRSTCRRSTASCARRNASMEEAGSDS